MDYEKKYKEAIGILEFLIGLETVQESGTIPVKDIINTFHELKSHNDERIRKSLISVFTTHKKEEMYYGTSVDEILEWLDKQGERKPYGQRKECTDCQFNYAGECKGFCAMKRSEQKPADNAEPKFKKGDWVVDKYGCVNQILSFRNGVYKHTQGYSAQVFEEDWHLWTIQDAKDGDVLTCYSDKKGQPIEQTGIIKQYVGRYGGCSNSFKAHFGVDWDNNVVIEGYMGSSNIYPSTKEQRDTLMKAMADAGYTFDFEKKELKKIEQKSAWSEEDETVLNNLIYALANDTIGNNRDEYVNWLKSLKDRFVPQSNQEWSEEEIENCAREAEDNNCIILAKHIRQLKSLRPQNRWKPSDEQMRILHWCMPLWVEPKLKAILESLINDLKKLREG